MSLSINDFNLFLDTLRFRQFPSSLSFHHRKEVPSRRWPRRELRITTTFDSSSVHHDKARWPRDSDTPVNSRLPPLSAGARRSYHIRKLSILEPITATSMDSQLFFDFPEHFTYTSDTMPQNQAYPLPDQIYNSADFVAAPISPFRTSFLEQTNSGVYYDHAPQSYMAQPNTSLNLYQPLPVFGPSSNQDIYGSYEEITDSSGTNLGLPQMLNNQYYPAEQHFKQGNDGSEEENHLRVQEYQDFDPSSTPEPYGHARHMSSVYSDVPKSTATSPHGTLSTDQIEVRTEGSGPDALREDASTPPPTTPTTPTTTPVRVLKFNNFVEAEAAAFNRVRPNVNDDDWLTVKGNPGRYVQKLLDAFGADYATQPEQFALVKEADKTRWLAYQDTHVDKTTKYDEDTIEAACWVLLKTLVEAHEIGLKSLRYHKSEDNITCSNHVTLIATALAKYAVIRYDVVRLQRLDELVCCTTSAVNRKIANFRGNANKTEREVENQQKAQAHGIKYVSVLGEKKRKGGEDEDVVPGGGGGGGRAPTGKKARKLAPAPLDLTGQIPW